MFCCCCCCFVVVCCCFCCCCCFPCCLDFGEVVYLLLLFSFLFLLCIAVWGLLVFCTMRERGVGGGVLCTGYELIAFYLRSEFPNTIAAEDVKFLSEFGRQYLLERALYWEQTGPLGPPRPPPTALGMRIKRAQTMASGMSHSSSQDMTSPRPKTVR